MMTDSMIKKMLEDTNIFHTQYVDIFLERYSDYVFNFDDEIFKKCITLMLIPDYRWETIFTDLRRGFCEQIASGSHCDDIILSFIESLSIQCFLNDYVYNYEDDEIEWLNYLKDNITGNEKYYAPVIACYEPIHNLVKPYKQDVFTKVQITDPLSVLDIQKTLERIGTIDDPISKLVRDQYLENPYPKWRYTDFMPEEYRIGKPSRVLIAGCGTGQQVISASQYKDAEITAIDLSDASVAYAKQKADEYGMNVRFIVMDLLNVELLQQQFDIIECGGVLHHMADPERGLSALCKVLAPGGQMKLGLYNRDARTAVTKVRNSIDNVDIRDFRTKVFHGHYPELEELTYMLDFYGYSTCRDYCFHECEHQFTLPQIHVMLNNNNLDLCEFVGMESSHMYQFIAQSRRKH